MDGIGFLGTTDLARVVDFYRAHFDVETWLEQDGCTVLRHGGFKFRFCDRETTDDCAILAL